VWTLWRFDWSPPGSGTYDLLVRMETADGRRSDPTPNDRPYVNWNGYGRLRITVL